MPSVAAVLTVACLNATMADDEAIAKVREAQAALDEGDVETARSLAGEVRARRLHEEAGGVYERATRLHALSFVRDPAAEPAEIEASARELRAEHTFAVEHGGAAPPLTADYGEALERAGDANGAYALLAPLADRDLIGSAYANAALARAADDKHDRARAELGRARCAAAASRPSICRGEYPPRPFFRGRALDFALAGFAVLGVAIVRAARRRVWSAHRARELSGAITIGGWGLFLLTNARLGVLAAVLTIAFALLLAAVQRRLFFRATGEGSVPGFRLRPLGPGDESAPLLRVFFGPAEPLALEPLADAGYRENARRPLLRIARRQVPARAGLVLAALALFVAGALASLLTLARGV
ncbi:MAG: hypothetical protein KIT84_29145 [Labilithrix sp.]|nr:hypothetical protein [Labilithrix sp.]MCW5815128.1 hypothetical protein [Labilithrix sp.]